MPEPSFPIQYAVVALAIALSMVAGTILALEVGRRIGRRRIAAAPEGPPAGLGTVEGAVFGLLGLLIAFTFSAHGSSQPSANSVRHPSGRQRPGS